MCKPKFKGGLGFKNLRFFNMALLAKQEWRILQEEGTMLHKVYRAKYFPKVSFFNYTLGHYPSYAWRGIWEAKNMLIQGGRWSIRIAKYVKIWKDYQILGHQVLR